MNRIYLDHAASTPMHPEAAQTMMDIMTGQFGNASSVHAFGRDAKRTVSAARDAVAASLGCKSEEIIFTSGGTESDNLALFGTATADGRISGHIITTTIEHHAVLHACAELEKAGYEVTYVPVNSFGRVNPADIEAAIRPDTFLISMMYANNEVGVIQPIHEVGQIAGEHGIVFHVDAVQAYGHIQIDCQSLPVDLLSVSGHKINGPQGVGALYIRQGTRIQPLMHGGLQEKKRRAGTENVAGIAGLAKAATLANTSIEERWAHDMTLRQTLLKALEDTLGKDAFVINGDPEYSLPNVLNLSFPDIGTETMLMNLDMEGIAAASGSACTSGSLELSHVLQAMDLPEDVLKSAIRFSFGLGNTTEEMEYTAKKIETIWKRLRTRY
ncbi:cysteine desulfurase (NifS protein-like) [Paenibacillus terrae HPL-003]|uniref:cysteine desulfurase n=1 Tax=Paenibacillus terrae (strain HPL-003) TaxID=985665 RepID=G7VSY4_PAETH|nr:cysteine desulfurase family protein [Paenibacillus terrae]AET62262.1 cysteine desulfurase (NifS protein-like) [Paenibacillus terrae HPL-003]